MIQREIQNDQITPISAYRQLGGEGCCMMESAFDAGFGKHSILAIEPMGTFRAYGQSIFIDDCAETKAFEGDPYKALKEFAKGRKAFGFISYGAVRLKEAIPDRHPKSDFPDFFFHIYKTVLVFDHASQKIICTHEGTEAELDALVQRLYQPALLFPFQKKKSVDLQTNIDKERYLEMIEQAKEALRAGEIFQIVLSRTFRGTIKASPFDVYRALRQVSPVPYLFFFEEKEFSIAGASPEQLIAVEKGIIESMPIAGTSPKSVSPEELLADEKEVSEHIMLVDLARNDIGAVSVPGSVAIKEFKKVKSFSHLNHIVSQIVGTLDPAIHPLDAFKASFPAGTLSGAPKVRAMELIDAIEETRRDLYGGAIVAIDEQGTLLSAIAIRTVLIRGSEAIVQTGGGIVLESDSEKEVEETLLKARGVVEALELAEGGYS